MSRINVGSGTTWEDLVGYSRAVRIGNHIEVAGTTAMRNGVLQGKDDYYVQAKVILEIISESLEKVGATLNDVLRTRIYVKDIQNWEAVAMAHRQVFDKIRPVTSMIQVNMINPEILVEIEATAVIL